jgi:hypothetical protein
MFTVEETTIAMLPPYYLYYLCVNLMGLVHKTKHKLRNWSFHTTQETYSDRWATS